MPDAPQEGAAVAAAAPEPSREDQAAAGRHLSNAIVVNLRNELRAMSGSDDLFDRVRARAGDPRRFDQEADLLGWSTLDQVVALYQAAVELTGDPDVPFRAGTWTFRVVATAEFVDQLRALGGPGQLLKLIGPVAARVTTITDAEPAEVGDRHAVIRYLTHPPHVRSPLLCRYTMGTLSSFPPVFGLAPGDVTELACQTRGDPHCVYRVTWDPVSSGQDDPEARIAALEERVEVLSSRYEMLQRVAAALTGTNDIHAVLQTVVRLAGVAVNAPHHVLAVQLPGERGPRIHAVGLSADRARVLAAELLATRAMPVGPGSWQGDRLVVDLATTRRHYGRLAAYATLDFLPDDGRLLTAYAGTAAASLEAAVAFEETRLLLEFSAQLADIATTSEMTARIAQAALRVVAADRAAVLLWEAADGRLVRSATARWQPGEPGSNGGADGQIEVEAAPPRRSAVQRRSEAVGGAGIVDWALRNAGQPSACGAHPALQPVVDLLGGTHAIAVPLVARRQVLGVMALDTGDREGTLDAEVVRRLAGVANLAASALHSARLLELVQHQANHDILTGLPNARLFTDRLTVALAAARRSDSRLAVLFVDLDGFKEVNDRLGHTAGDQVLREVATRLRQTVREEDSVARVGGDEFVVLVPEVDTPDDAEAARDRLVAALAGSPLHIDGVDVPLRASIGIASYPEDGLRPGDLLHHADVVMYRHKLAGRGTRA